MMDKPIPILYVHTSSTLYGADQSLLTLITRLDRARFEPIVVVPDHGPLTMALQDLGVEVIIEPLSVLHRSYSPAYWWRFLTCLPASVKRLQRLIRQRGIRLVHSNTSHVFNGALAARAARIPHIWHIRELNIMLSELGYPLRHFIYAYSEAIVAISSAVAQLWRKQPGCTSKIHVVHDGVNITRFHPGLDPLNVRSELGIEAGTPLIGVVGRISYWKGHALFLRAAAQVREGFPDARFLIVGDAVTPGDHRVKQELFQLVHQLGLEQSVIFAGVRPDIPDVMTALDLLVLPSETPEPLGLVILEAMAVGRPVVATAHGGPLDVVADGETGFLVPPGDPQAMAEAIMSLLRVPEGARRMGQAGRLRCEQHFNAERYSQKITHIYEEILWKTHGVDV